MALGAAPSPPVPRTESQAALAVQGKPGASGARPILSLPQSLLRNGGRVGHLYASAPGHSSKASPARLSSLWYTQRLPSLPSHLPPEEALGRTGGGGRRVARPSPVGCEVTRGEGRVPAEEGSEATWGSAGEGEGAPGAPQSQSSSRRFRVRLACLSETLKTGVRDSYNGECGRVPSWVDKGRRAVDAAAGTRSVRVVDAQDNCSHEPQ